jgi:hypothetical protein
MKTVVTGRKATMIVPMLATSEHAAYRTKEGEEAEGTVHS